jgi:polyphosphate kinase
MLSFNSYSQEDIIKQDTSKVVIPTRIARLIYQDLLRYDGSKLEIVELNKIITLKDEQIVLYKQKDIFKDQKIGNLDLIISKKDEQFSLEREKSNSLLKELKGEKRKTFIYKIGTYVAIITTGLLLVK